MPLYKSARKLIRRNLQSCSCGVKPRLVVIGSLTQKQVDDVNQIKTSQNLPPITAEVVFDGRHMYRSRCIGNGYTIDEIIEQIESAMDESANILPYTRMTTMTSTKIRKDKYGNDILDQAVFECTARHPRPELYSVIPRGDKIRPSKIGK